MTLPINTMTQKLNRGMIVTNATAVNERTDIAASDSMYSSQWLAGTPLTIGANGYDLATVTAGTGACDIMCIAAKSYGAYINAAERIAGQDAATLSSTYSHQVYAVSGAFLCQMYGDSIDGTAAVTYPFSRSVTWGIGDKVYLGTDEKWTNVAIGSEKRYGVVTNVFGSATAPDGLEIQFESTRQQ